MPKFRVVGKVQVAVMVTVEARSETEAMRIARDSWEGLSDIHAGKAVTIFDNDDLDPEIAEDGSEPEWVGAEKIKDERRSLAEGR